VKICIDATRFVIENAGIARYIKNIVALLAHVTAPGDELCFIVTFMRHYARKDEKIAWLKKYGSVHVHIIPGKWKEYFWEKNGQEFTLNDGLADVMFFLRPVILNCQCLLRYRLSLLSMISPQRDFPSNEVNSSLHDSRVSRARQLIEQMRYVLFQSKQKMIWLLTAQLTLQKLP